MTSPAVLRNKGIEVDVAVVAYDDHAVAARHEDGDGNPKTEKRWVKVTNNVLADIESAFGSLAEYERATSTTPFLAVRRVLAFVWDVPEKEAGLMMLDGQLDQYSTAVGVAFMLANGVDPTKAAEALRIGVRQTAERRADMESEVDEMLRKAEAEEDGSSGTSGSRSGSAAGNAATTSGP